MLKSDKAVRSCGNNESGQLGDGTTISRSTQVPVALLDGVVAIAACKSHTLAIDGRSTTATSDNTVAAWGDNGYGRLGNGTTISSSLPVTVKVEVAAGVGALDLTGATAISCGHLHSLTLLP